MRIIIKASVFGGSVELPIERPDPFNQVLLSEFSNRVAQALQIPMASEQFRVRIGDALFWYELVGSFFGGNVQVRKTADRATLTFKNAGGQGDLEFIGTRTARFLEAFATGPHQVVI